MALDAVASWAMGGDADAIRRSLQDPEAFGEIFERHYVNVVRYTQRRCGRDAGEDIAEQTFEVAFERRTSFDTGVLDARPWLFGIAHNLLRHHFRDESTHLAALKRMPVFPNVEPFDDVDHLDAERLRPEIVGAIESLRRGDREVFLLYALGDLTYDEVAHALGIPVGTVRSRIHRARAILRERMLLVVAIEEETDGRT
jgi:RNA polymerase sigma factor (sigma-70 family)